MISVRLYTLCTFLYFGHIQISSAMLVKINELKTCDGKNHTINIVAKQKIVDGEQLHHWVVMLGKDLDEKNTFDVTISRVAKTRVIKIISMKGSNACKALSEYGGNVVTKVAKDIKVPGDGQCPIPKGTYTLNWGKIPLDGIGLLKLVPKGIFQLDINTYDLQHVLDACFIVHAEKM